MTITWKGKTPYSIKCSLALLLEHQDNFWMITIINQESE